MPAPPQLLELVERFESHQVAYLSGQYKETQLRRDFIDTFFTLLGWDVDNRQGYAEAYRDVIHEDAIKVGGVTKAPDYCYRIGGTRKFFVEAKKPSVHIKEDVSAAYQLRRYAWSAKLPLSILTDFEEFAVYDCREKPSRTDKASKGRTLYLTYKDYARRWDEIAEIFTKEAILKGSFDRYAEENKLKRGTAEVDAAFLEEIEGWRDSLARNIALRNPTLTSRELNTAVQYTINRIVFLRICEARGIEPYGILLSLTNGAHVYSRLCEHFQQADQKYNSGLFHFRDEKGTAEAPDELTLFLAIDDKPLRDIIKHLYYPDSPYEFGFLPIDTLGQVYERFLGKVISLTSRHQAIIEEKPEVKKAGGVFYTPTYIVDYVVENTVGTRLEGKKPKDVADLRIVDIACGSGSFLIGAYQYLLDWYRDAYVKDGAQKHKKELYQLGPVDYRLTPDEKKRILLTHIYGVDIDAQAVEVTKLSLLLKVLEEETGETLASQLQFFHQRALPNLSSNIKCGNSLIGPEFYAAHQLGFFTEDEKYRINVFDWQEEFPEVFRRKNSGFDVVIGNPPYIRIQTMKEWAPIEVEYYKQKYKAASKGNYDIYVVFVEKGISLLNGKGTLGYILPHKFFNAQYGEPLREQLARHKQVSHIVHFGDEQVFAGATTYTCLLFLEKSGTDHCHFVKVDDLLEWRTQGKGSEGDIPASSITSSEWNFTVGSGASLFERLSKMPAKLGDVTDKIAQGIRTSANEVYVLDLVSLDGDVLTAFSKHLNTNVQLDKDSIAFFLLGREIKSYRILPSGKVVIVPYHLNGGVAQLIDENKLHSNWPHTWQYLNNNKSYLQQREKGRFKGPRWHAYGREQNIALMLQPKILVPDIADRASFALDNAGEYAFTSGYGITLKPTVSESHKYILGLLNSKLLDFYLKRVSTTLRGGFFRYFTQFVEQLPIRTIDFSNPADKAKHDRIVSLVEQMLSLHKQSGEARTSQAKNTIQRQVAATDKLINGLVYGLYGLSGDEVKIVEQG